MKMKKIRACRSGFTLVELIIVIVILGILASIAIPSIMGSTDRATETALAFDLKTLRKSLQTYSAQHLAQFPGAKEDGLGNKVGAEVTAKNQLIYYTDKTGKVSKTKDPKFPFGPYLQKEFPKVPVGAQVGKDTIKVTADKGALVADDDTKGAWMYSYETGEIICNDTSTDSGGTKKFSEY